MSLVWKINLQVSNPNTESHVSAPKRYQGLIHNCVFFHSLSSPNSISCLFYSNKSSLNPKHLLSSSSFQAHKLEVCVAGYLGVYLERQRCGDVVRAEGATSVPGRRHEVFPVKRRGRESRTRRSARDAGIHRRTLPPKQDNSKMESREHCSLLSITLTTNWSVSPPTLAILIVAGRPSMCGY